MINSIDEMGSPKKFGKNWKIHKEIIAIHENQFLDWINPFLKENFSRKLVLDAGCGIGRNCHWVVKYGAEKVIGFDLEKATVQIAQTNLQQYNNCDIESGSIYTFQHELTGQFDIALCIGVLHHLADPKRAVENLLRQVSPGGILIFWVYGFEGNENLLKLLIPVRTITSRLPFVIVNLASYPATFFIRLIIKLKRSKIEYWNKLQKYNFHHIRSIIVDQLIPKIAHYYTQENLIEIFGTIPSSSLKINRTNGNSWTVLLQRDYTQK